MIEFNLFEEDDFIAWIEIVLDRSISKVHDENKLMEIVKELQIKLSEDSFMDIVVFADNECNCENYDNDLKCMYCRIFSITSSITTALYLDRELLNLDEFENLK